MRFGLPSGVEFFLDIFAISFFVFMIGRFGQVELAATSAVFSIYSLAFMPVIGLNIAASILVGQAMGDHNPALASFSTQSVFHVAMAYMAAMAVLFVLFPEALLNLFRARGGTASDFNAVLDMGVVLMRYAAAFTLIDAVFIIYAGALKGAGDTRYTMIAISIASVFCMILRSSSCMPLEGGASTGRGCACLPTSYFSPPPLSSGSARGRGSGSR